MPGVPSRKRSGSFGVAIPHQEVRFQKLFFSLSIVYFFIILFRYLRVGILDEISLENDRRLMIPPRNSCAMVVFFVITGLHRR